MRIWLRAMSVTMSEDDDSDAIGFGKRVIKQRERLEDWFYLGANRLLVAGVLLVFVLAIMLILRATGIIPLGSVDSMFYVFGGLIGGNLTLISLVVSMNQLILSRQLGAPGEVREQRFSIEDSSSVCGRHRFGRRVLPLSSCFEFAAPTPRQRIGVRPIVDLSFLDEPLADERIQVRIQPPVMDFTLIVPV